MSATSSHVGTAEDAIYTLLSTAAGTPSSALYGVTVTRGNPAGRLERENVWVGENSEAEQEWEVTGSGVQAKRETITMEVYVWVSQGDDAYVTTRDRALQMSAVVEDELREHFNLSGQVFDASVVRMTKAAGPVEYGQAVLLTLEVQVIAWLA